MSQPISVRVPATTANLGPGFDTLGAAVSLHLRATVGPLDGPRVVTSGEGADELPDDDGNLLWQAFLALCTHLGAPVPEVSVHVDNAVPLERGLGSSSAAIVAGLGLARAVLAASVSDVEVVRIATAIEGHPDNVAPAVLGGLVATARADDGELVVRRAQPHPRLRPVAFVPEARQSTTAARGVIPDTLPREDVVDHAARAAHVLTGLAGVWPVDARLAGDRLHEPSRLAVMTATGALVEELRADRIHAWLSGAGPSVVAAVGRRDADVVRRCRELGSEHDFRVLELDWDLSGVTAA